MHRNSNTKGSKEVTKRICGVGINDADYIISIRETIGYTDSGRQLQKLIWICPFYQRWHSMLRRSYSKKYHLKNPSYIGCSVIEPWHYFMTFRSWMETQDWEGKVLDKDLLIPGNKIYGPETCVFVSETVNNFLPEANAIRGEWPIGVCYNRQRNKYQANCMDFTTGKLKYLGLYENPLDAHKAWLSFKLEQAKILASMQTDERVAKALIWRYENYGS